MSRRPGDEQPTGPESIEIIESDSAEAGATEVVETGRRASRSIGIAVAIMGALAITVLALTTSSEQGISPSTSAAPPAAAEVTEPPAAPAALIGEGPSLEWDQINWDIGANDFRWIDGAFVGDNGETEWGIRPTRIDAAVEQRPSLEVAYPGYYRIAADGTRVLAPRSDQADHVLFLPTEGDSPEPMRVDLPIRVPTTDLVIRRSMLQAAAVGNTAVVVIERVDRVNPVTLGERIGVDLAGRQPTVRLTDLELQIDVAAAGTNVPDSSITIALDELDLTQTELGALRPRDSQFEVLAVDLDSATTGPPGIVPDGRADLGVVGDRFVLSWDNGDMGHVSTSSNGRTWQPLASRVGIINLSGDATSMVGLDRASGSVARSGNGAISWQFTPEPFSPFDLTVANDRVVLWQPTAARTGIDPTDWYEIELTDYDLIITGGGRSFRLIDRTTGESVSAGSVDDPTSGAALDPFDGRLTVIDPTTGETITVNRTQLEFAYATTGRPNQPFPLLGFARWDGGRPPVWRLEPLSAVFGPSAIGVDFVSGGGHLLAVVTTRSGYQFHIADVG